MKNTASRLTILPQTAKTHGKYGYNDQAYGIENHPHIKILVSGNKCKPAFDSVIGEMQKEKNSRIVRRDDTLSFTNMLNTPDAKYSYNPDSGMGCFEAFDIETAKKFISGYLKKLPKTELYNNDERWQHEREPQKTENEIIMAGREIKRELDKSRVSQTIGI